MDPLAFRLKNLKDDRLRAAFQTAADRFGWGQPRAEGHGVGIAGGFEKGGYIATAVEVAVDRRTGSVKLVRGVSAFDCGAVVNPDILRNQVEGAFIQGIGGALFEAIDFDHGVIRNAHLAQYRVPRFSDVPDLDVVLIDRKDRAARAAPARRRSSASRPPSAPRSSTPPAPGCARCPWPAEDCSTG